MKKIISKLAMASIAVAGLFTSCVVDDIETSFDLADAQCKVKVSVVYALDQSDITSQTTITSKYGNTAEITVPATNKTVEAQTLSITAKFKDLPESTQTVNIATLLPGGSAEYSVKFVFGSKGDLKYTEEEVSSVDEPHEKYLTNSHYSHASHSGETDNWLYNDSEFILDGTVEYEKWTGTEILSIDPETDATVKAFADARKEEVKKTTETLDFKVSAWARYKAWATLTISTKTFDVYENNTVLGTKTKLGSYSCKVYESNMAQPYEEANPGHEAHWHYGHGTHDTHGTHANAGGGIFFSE